MSVPTNANTINVYLAPLKSVNSCYENVILNPGNTASYSLVSLGTHTLLSTNQISAISIQTLESYTVTLSDPLAVA